MAIHPTVMYSPDRHLRITADPAGTVFTVERDLVFVARFTNLADLVTFLADNGVSVEQLIVD